MRRKLLFLGWILLLGLLSTQRGFSYGEIDVNGIMYEIDFYETQTAKVVAYVDDYYNKIPYEGDVDIPSEITYREKAYPVTGIGANAFYQCDRLASVKIPGSVTNIEKYAFYGCKGLMNIRIPEGVHTIGNKAFSQCTGLASISFPRGVKNLGHSAFEGCVGIKDVIFNDDLEIIGDYAFINCYGLTSVTIPTSVTYVGENAFSNCNLRSLNILDSKAVIKSWAFWNNQKLVSVNLGKNIHTIEPAAFYDCKALPSIYIPNSVTALGESCFVDCANLSSVFLPNGISFIGWGTFMHCYSLETVYIPNSVTAMYGEVFRFDVEVDGSYIHEYDNKLRDVYMFSVSAPKLGRHNITDDLNTFRDYQYDKITVHVPYGSSGKYRSANEWSRFKNIVEMEPSTSVTVPDNGGFCTFFCGHPFKVPAGLKCGIVTEENHGNLSIAYRYTEGMTVPAWTGVLLKGTPNATYTLLYDDQNKDRSPEDNLLFGALKEGTTFAPGFDNKYYKLSYEKTGGAHLGWYWGAPDGAAFSMPAHRAFLALPNNSSLSMINGLILSEMEETTGIEENTSTSSLQKIFDIHGRQVNVKDIQKLVKGLYIINGKKVIIK